MRTFCDSTEIPLAWTRATAQNYPYFICFPETKEELDRQRSMPSYRGGNHFHVAAYQTVVKYNDFRYDQKRNVKLVMGVCTR